MSQTHTMGGTGPSPTHPRGRHDAGPDAGPRHPDPDDAGRHPGPADAVIAGAARVSDALMEVGEALVAALIGAVVGAGKAAAGIWVADRPRRQMVRLSRRRRWLQRRGWWRAAVVLELVGIGAFMGGRAAVRAVRGVPGGAAQGARTGWATGRGRAQDRRGTRSGRPRRTPGPPPGATDGQDWDWGAPHPSPGPTTPGPSGPTAGPTSGPTPAASGSAGEAIVDAEILCGRPGCDTVLSADDPGPLCPPCQAGHTAQAVGDDVQVSVHVAAPTDPSPPEPRIIRDGYGGRDWIAPGDGDVVASSAEDLEREGTRRPDGRPETDRDRRFFDLRDAGYLGPIDQDHHPVASMDIDARRLTPQEVAAAIAAGGYPLAQPAPEAAPTPAAAPQMSDGHPAAGPGPTGSTPGESINQHDHEHDDVQEDTGMSTTDMTITSGSGGSGVQGGAQMGQQLTAVGDLRAEVTVMRGYVETGAAMLRELESWAAGLPDQVAAAEWSTEAVTQAAVGLAEARTVEEVRSGITSLLSAAAEAERLGQALAVGGATKGVAGLRPQ